MKRLIFISNLFPTVGEPYRGLDNATLLHHLAARWEIKVLSPRSTLPWGRPRWTPREADALFAPQFIPAPYLPKIGSRVNAALMARALRPILHQRLKKGFDVVLSSWIYPDSCAVAELAREMQFPFVAIAQGSDVHQYLKMPARRKIIVPAMAQASAIVTRSAELARLLGEAGVDREKLHPIDNGIDPSRFHPGDRAAARRELSLAPGGRVILFVGNFFPIKNPLLLIEALAEVCSNAEASQTTLILAGGGPLETSMRALARRLALGERIVFAGRQDAAGVARLMQAADLLALPSDNEGVPNVMLEAFACGLPVVASRVGGIPEAHAGDSFGRLVEPRRRDALAAALRAVLLAPPARAPIAAFGQSFTWEKSSAAYEALLLQAVRSNRLAPTQP